MAVLFLTDRRLQRHRLLRNLQNLPNPLHGKLHLFRNLLRGRLSSQFLQKLTGYTDQLIDGLYHVHRNPNGSGLIRNGSCDSLTNPPGSIGAELIALTIVKLLYGFN